MAYGDWMPEFQELWEELPVGELSGPDYQWAEYVFEVGFMSYHGEEAPGVIQEARNELFSMLGPEWEEYFDWEGWREAMGYD